MGCFVFIFIKNHIQNKCLIEYLDCKYNTTTINTLNHIIDNIKLIEEINQNELVDNLDYIENIKFLKYEIILNLYQIMQEVLIDIVVKYQINMFKVEELITELRQLKINII